MNILIDTDNMNSKVDCIIFDLVGVLIEFCGPDEILKLSNGNVGIDIFSDFWAKSEWALNFSKGTCSPEDFARGAIDYFGLDIRPDRFIENYKTWYVGPYPGAIELVYELRKSFKVGCLSNINELYVPRFLQDLQLNKIMDDCIFSCEVGMIKPDPNIFHLAAERLNTKTENILFFDDSQMNVNAALLSGMLAKRVDGPKGVYEVLDELGIRGIV